MVPNRKRARRRWSPGDEA
uniref:Uncharacterized protein n=1 Tax=Arundo donax TaxID=35708 RepID=A0A0A9BTB5_ARUDO